MARKSKDVYGRIEEKEQEIRNVEERLTALKQELIELNSEKDNLEMHQLFEFIRNNNISFEDAKALMSKVS